MTCLEIDLNYISHKERRYSKKRMADWGNGNIHKREGLNRAGKLIDHDRNDNSSLLVRCVHFLAFTTKPCGKASERGTGSFLLPEGVSPVYSDPKSSASVMIYLAYYCPNV